jgi:DNA-binding transcriptional MerR regulator
MSKPAATMKYLRIGQITDRTGVSRKALRLYEARGLLAPDGRSAAGYRLYGAKALTRLAEIGVLKRAGFMLSEIGKLLEHDGSAAALVEARIAALRVEVAAKSRALVALERAWRGLASASQTIDQLVEDIQMNEELDMRFSKAEMAEFKHRAEALGKHFTPDERERMRRRAEELGESRVQQVNAAWPGLIADVRTAMDAGTPPTDPAVQDMGRRWHALVQAFTGGDAAIGRRMKEAYDKEPQVMAAQGMDHAMFAYIRDAMRAAGLELST